MSNIFISNEKFNLVEDPAINYVKQIAEVEKKHVELIRENSQLKNDVAVLRELVSSKEENIGLMKELIKKKGSK